MDDAAALAVMKRGIEPLRIRIGGRQRIRRAGERRRLGPEWRDALPVVIG